MEAGAPEDELAVAESRVLVAPGAIAARLSRRREAGRYGLGGSVWRWPMATPAGRLSWKRQLVEVSQVAMICCSPGRSMSSRIDCCVVDELVVESGKRRRARRAVAGLERRGPIDDQQVDLVWHLIQSIPRRVPLQGGVDHASDLVEVLSLQVVLYEGRPVGVMLKRGEYAALAFV